MKLGLLCFIVAAGASCSGPADQSEPLSMAAASAPVPPVLVVSHPDARVLSIVDTFAERVVATIRIPGRVGPVALSSDGERAFVSTPDAIVVVNVPARAIERTLKLPGDHAGLVLGPDRLYASENIDNKGKVSAIDPASGRATSDRTIPDLAGRPEITSTAGALYVPHNFYSGKVTVLDGRAVSDSARAQS